MTDNEQIMLARLDERLRAVQTELTHVSAQLQEYVTMHQFKPVQMLAYGLTGLLLSAVIGALVASIIR